MGVGGVLVVCCLCDVGVLLVCCWCVGHVCEHNVNVLVMNC